MGEQNGPKAPKRLFTHPRTLPSPLDYVVSPLDYADQHHHRAEQSRHRIHCHQRFAGTEP